jgi:RNA polymerase sigma-70 factor (ECF subfamily)
MRKRQYQTDGQKLEREARLTASDVESHRDSEELDLQNAWDDEWETNIFQAASAKVKSRVSAAHYQMFDLHVLKQVPAKEVSNRLGVKLAEVYVAKYKVSHLLKKHVKLLEKKGVC